MILIDAVFINNGGGKILLDYLFDEMSKKNNPSMTFLIDSRLKDEYKHKENEWIKIIFINGFFQRSLFYMKNKITFHSVLCFGNIPPNVKMKSKVFTYFHQLIYLDIPLEFSTIQKLKFQIKINILRLFSKNTDFWITQTDFVKKSLSNKFGIAKNKIEVLPFYPRFTEFGAFNRQRGSLLYVSNANPHKNHKNLINAFCQFFDLYKFGILTLTVNEAFPEIVAYINEKQKQGYPINNIGFVSRSELYKEYHSHQYLIFPSSSESFGLGLVEAIENGCKIIGSDLPYTHEVCIPSILIENPQEEKSILAAMIKGINYEDIPFSQQKVQNNIQKLLHLLDN